MPDPDPTKTRISETVRLLRLAQSGDKRALNDLYARYGERLRMIVRLRLGPRLRSKMESCDVAQEALAASLRHIENATFESEGAFLHWLTKLVENRIRDLADHFGAQRRDVGRETPLEISSPSRDSVAGPIAGLAAGGTPSSAAMRAEDSDRLERATDQLAADQREALILVRYAGLTLAEAGAIMDRSADAVRMLVGRAIVQLGKAMTATDR